MTGGVILSQVVKINCYTGLYYITVKISFYLVEFPTRANVYLIVNGDKQIKKKLTKVLANLLNGISLREHRLALYSTNGLSDRIVDFQSKDWLLKNFL